MYSLAVSLLSVCSYSIFLNCVLACCSVVLGTVMSPMLVNVSNSSPIFFTSSFISGTLAIFCSVSCINFLWSGFVTLYFPFTIISIRYLMSFIRLLYVTILLISSGYWFLYMSFRNCSIDGSLLARLIHSISYHHLLMSGHSSCPALNVFIRCFSVPLISMFLDCSLMYCMMLSFAWSIAFCSSGSLYLLFMMFSSQIILSVTLSPL